MISLTIHSWLVEEIDATATWYQSQFATGATDFLLAVADTFERIERLPLSGPIRHPENPDIRGLQVKNTQAEAGQARRFPYVLVYQVRKERVIAYQLWSMRSGRGVSKPPESD